LQSGAGIGSFLASGVWLLIGGLGTNSWRVMYLVGVLPALLVFWIWRYLPESERWEQSNERRRAAQALRRTGAALVGEHAALARFTIVDMFLDKEVRRRLIPARKKADSEGLRRFESDEVDSSLAEHVMRSPLIELIRGGGAWLRFRSKRV
jgi:MFS family permease